MQLGIFQTTFAYIKAKAQQTLVNIGERRMEVKKVRWECVEVSHHKNIGNMIEEWEKKGYNLHSYAAAGNPGAISHYLLFKR